MYFLFLKNGLWFKLQQPHIYTYEQIERFLRHKRGEKGGVASYIIQGSMEAIANCRIFMLKYTFSVNDAMYGFLDFSYGPLYLRFSVISVIRADKTCWQKQL